MKYRVKHTPKKSVLIITKHRSIKISKEPESFKLNFDTSWNPMHNTDSTLEHKYRRDYTPSKQQYSIWWNCAIQWMIVMIFLFITYQIILPNIMK